METAFLLIANIILYSILIFINFKFKNLFDRKLENYRTENTKTIEMFRDELFKKNRRFELKYDIYKGLAKALPQIHWVITQFDWGKLTEAFENLWFWRSLVSNFYGKNVKKELDSFRDEATKIQKKRDELNIELNKVSWERVEIEEQKRRYMNIISSAKPKDFKEIMDRILIETQIKTRDEEILKKQIEAIVKLFNGIKSDFEKIYPLCEKLLIAMAVELKEEYQLEN